jgi:Uma2 family endonuclease
MGMSPVAKVWTREEVLALPDDGNRYELVDGELLVSPSPRGAHQRGVGELYLLVAPYVRAHRQGYAAVSPADLDLRSGQLLQPDLFVGALVEGREPVDWTDYAIPILVVEVASPSTARYDRITKRRRYQRSGVPTYWIVDLDARLVEVWTPGADRPEVVDDTLTWQPDSAAPALAIDLPSYFRRVWAEG